ncbi:unnamed protein product [Protopolystoma xenopodis]|uniref:SH3 domain-containing protein n=1 Tax=Protopolystoma xenopodis TaxID=117903 RepID=A0A448X3L4_9PLAT|nr:unnamed protein product [Protopolystoma xenopodis]
MSVANGEYLELLDDSRNWHEVRNSQGKAGYCPYTILNTVEVALNSSPGDTRNMSYEMHGRERGF